MTINRSLAAIATVVLVAVAPVSAARAQSADIAAVAEAGERLRTLMISPDRPALEEIMADQLSYGHSDGRVQTRAELIDALLKRTSVFHSITLSDQTISLAGDVSIVRHRFAADAESNGKATQPRIRVLQVWQKQGGTWKLLVRQAH